LIKGGRAHTPPPRKGGARADLRRACPDPRQGDRSLPAAMSVEALNRTLEQELFGLLRGASLECLVCGEFVPPRAGRISCPECQAEFGSSGEARLQLPLQAG